jgi:hypothetical protein
MCGHLLSETPVPEPSAETAGEQRRNHFALPIFLWRVFRHFAFYSGRIAASARRGTCAESSSA